MYYYDHGQYHYDPKAAPLFGAPTGYGIPAHDLSGAWDSNDLDAWAKPPVNESTTCYCGYKPEPHEVGVAGHGTDYVPTPDGTAVKAYDDYANGLNVVPSTV